MAVSCLMTVLYGLKVHWLSTCLTKVYNLEVICSEGSFSDQHTIQMDPRKDPESRMLGRIKDQNFVSRGGFGWLGNGNVSKIFRQCFRNISKVTNIKIIKYNLSYENVYHL
ncbi:uncharacterized protein LOC130782669 [Actinidia eriantha]|uniref:uncharacterized protein LOC130782669 n=1 Tax=Actinidia eriantha TaxID=165200 RepID=UPI00258B51AC|nr:uncharacterized protein LOC130782669 [Actinidia eriantha]